MIGTLTPKMLDTILETIPVELTILDEKDRIIAWNTRRPRLFARSEKVLGADVRSCHSPESVPTIDRLLGEMRSGARDAARMWYDHRVDGRTRKILIEYLAIRGEDGAYLGCVEALQDVEPMRALEGERRTLDD